MSPPPAARSATLARRPQRADGRRNYDNILAAARTAFDEGGTSASLEDIARAAGVAIGTLYGHFPTREALIEATMRDGLDQLRASADALAETENPAAALTLWFRQAVAHCSTFRGLVGLLATSSYDEGTPLHHACVAMHESCGQLLRRAQGSGHVRADLSPDDLFTMITSAAWTRENATADHDPSDRLIDLLLDAIIRTGRETSAG
ncbi:helix-turn-helix domain-containing protein [Dactylosporangium sp. NPDC000555]|uniref:TetR/AcrR family transcriptional regulator n=1 Tax=Dactylosporangium sp. NPDC000555 TaxID=3154260 RepID=UPI00332E9BEE